LDFGPPKKPLSSTLLKPYDTNNVLKTHKVTKSPRRHVAGGSSYPNFSIVERHKKRYNNRRKITSGNIK